MHSLFLLAAVSVGYMLDISRDKVPTTDSLHRIVDVIAAAGYNQFQLYSEHTFAYRGHERVWKNEGGMSPEEIRELDDYCAAKGIELVPNQNSLGHLEKWLRWPDYRPYAEAPYGGCIFWGTPRAYPCAVCPTDPKTLGFVYGLYDQLLPNFRSTLINVGLDEVMELKSDGRGRSWSEVEASSPEQVWMKYFRTICAELERRGRTVMFWDDMITRHHPELLPELPGNAVALNWGYEVRKSNDTARFTETTKRLAAAKRRFYVCPGTSGWNAITGRYTNMKTNVVDAVSCGLANGAEGFLMTDWGNGGHCQPFLTALPALVYMRAMVDGKALSDDEVAAAVDRLAGAKCGRALIRYQDLYLKSGCTDCINHNTIHRFLSTGRPQRGMTDATVAAIREEHAAAKRDLDLAGAPGWVADGFRVMDLMLEAFYLRWAGEHERIAAEFPAPYRELWLKYNRGGNGLDDSVKVNFGTPAKTEVLFSFDTEDFTSPRNADGIAAILDILDDEGVTGHFQIVGELAKKLREWGREDLIRRLRGHVICTHTRFHSVHPDILEQSDTADYAAAYARIRAQEEESLGILRDVFGVKKIWSSCPPGNSESYVAGYVYRDLGVNWDLGAGYLANEGEPLEFAGQKRIPYVFNFECFQRDARPAARKRWPEDREAILRDFAKNRRMCVYCHPNKVYSTEFWDGLNYRGGNNCEWGKWKLPKERPAEEVKEYLAAIRGLVRAIKEDPHFTITILPLLEAVEKPRKAIGRKELAAIAKDWKQNGMGPVTAPASWCVADVFRAAVSLLRGEAEYLPTPAYGFLEYPVGSLKSIEVSRAELTEAAQRIDLNGFLPHEIELAGGRRIGPRQFLESALVFLTSDAEKTVAVAGDQLGEFGPLKKLQHRVYRGTWLHQRPPEFNDEFTADRLHWQIWTVRR